MFFVYLIRSVANPEKTYVGYTANFRKRLEEHNAGKSPVTKSDAPWQTEILVQFRSMEKAKAFEKYLKHGSGHAFAKKHFWS